MNTTRFRYGLAFLFLGLITLNLWCWEIVFGIMSWLKIHFEQVAWCAGWALAGIGLGLINSRNRGSRRHRKYLGYFALFVFFIATSSALLAGLLVLGKDSLVFYISSMLVAIGVGFTGDSLAGKLVDWIQR